MGIDHHPDPNTIITQTRCWVERIVIAHNLCPFAHRPFETGRIHYAVSTADAPEELLAELNDELDRLRDTPVDQLETTLLIHPGVLLDFLDYNDFLDIADALIEERDEADSFQIASFHPDYRFADTRPGDAENYTNRSPYPMLHLLRQDSLSAALEHYPNPEDIPQRNIEKLKALGADHIRTQLIDCMNETGVGEDKTDGR